MADQARAILAGIEALLVTKTAAGQDLEDIVQYDVLYTESVSMPEYAYSGPVLKVDMLPVSITTVSIPPCMMRKVYPVRFQVFVETAGDTSNTDAAILLDAVEDVFFQQLFSISNLMSDVTNKDYAVPSESPVNGGASMTITYTDTDIRAIP